MIMVMRMLLLVAGFAFGAMPIHGIAQAAVSAAASGMEMAADAASPHHHGAMTGHADIPCPHATIPTDTDRTGHAAVAGGHCSACLTLAPMILFAHMGRSPRSDELPGLAPQLESLPAAPLERPPRIRG